VYNTPELCKELYPKQLKELLYNPGEIVDVYDADTKEWKIGKIQHTAAMSTSEIFVTIEGRGNSASKEVKVDRRPQDIAPFMTYTANFNEIEVLPLYHRYKKTDDNFVYFGLPKLLAVGTWATCSQIASEVMLQVKPFLKPEQKGRSMKIRPFKSIVSGGVRGKRIADPPVRASTFSLAKNSSLFSITMIDMSTNTCAICSSRQITGQKFLYSSKQKQCKGCNLLDNKDLPIKYEYKG